MKRLTKYEIACKIERLPGNVPYSKNWMITNFYDSFTRSELVERFNSIVRSRCLDLSLIS